MKNEFMQELYNLCQKHKLKLESIGLTEFQFSNENESIDLYDIALYFEEIEYELIKKESKKSQFEK